jgi:hypothetical protein
MTWEQAMHKYPVVTVDDGDEKTSDAATASTSNGKATVVVNTGRARFSRPAAKIQ